MPEGIDWAQVVAAGLVGGATMLAFVVAWSIVRAVWRGLRWALGSPNELAERAQRAALDELLHEAEQRGYRRGLRAADAHREAANRTGGPDAPTPSQTHPEPAWRAAGPPPR
jgi:hypothetical protein